MTFQYDKVVIRNILSFLDGDSCMCVEKIINTTHKEMEGVVGNILLPKVNDFHYHYRLVCKTFYNIWNEYVSEANIINTKGHMYGDLTILPALKLIYKWNGFSPSLTPGVIVDAIFNSYSADILGILNGALHMYREYGRMFPLLEILNNIITGNFPPDHMEVIIIFLINVYSTTDLIAANPERLYDNLKSQKENLELDIIEESIKAFNTLLFRGLVNKTNAEAILLSYMIYIDCLYYKDEVDDGILFPIIKRLVDILIDYEYFAVLVNFEPGRWILNNYLYERCRRHNALMKLNVDNIVNERPKNLFTVYQTLGKLIEQELNVDMDTLIVSDSLITSMIVFLEDYGIYNQILRSVLLASMGRNVKYIRHLRNILRNGEYNTYCLEIILNEFFSVEVIEALYRAKVIDDKILKNTIYTAVGDDHQFMISVDISKKKVKDTNYYLDKLFNKCYRHQIKRKRESPDNSRKKITIYNGNY